MTVAVTTPTGNVGSALVGAVVRAGERPVVLVRDPARLAPDLLDHVDAWQGDLGDPAFLGEALAGVDRLYLVLPEVLTTADPEADAEALADAVLEAVETSGVRRVVFQSSVGAERREGVGFIDVLGRTEERLDALAARTGMAVCHLRCGYFFTNLLMDPDALRAGTLAQAMPADLPMPWVDPVDIAAVAAGRLLSDGWSGSVVQGVHGPEDLTFAAVAGIVSAATGWDVTFRQTSDDEVREQLAGAGMSALAIESVVGMGAGLRAGNALQPPRSVLTTTPSHLAGWAYDHLRPGTSAS